MPSPDWIFGVGTGAAGVFDGDVLNRSAEVGEAPCDVLIVADDDEGNSGKREAGYVEVTGGSKLECRPRTTHRGRCD